MPLNDFINIYFYPRDYVLYRELNSIILSMNYHDHTSGKGHPIPHGKSSDPFANYGDYTDGAMCLLGPDNHHAQEHLLTIYDENQQGYDKPHTTKVIDSETADDAIISQKLNIPGIVKGQYDQWINPDAGKCMGVIGDPDCWDSRDGSLLSYIMADNVVLCELGTTIADQSWKYPGKNDVITVEKHIASIGDITKVSNNNPHGMVLADINGYTIIHTVNLDSINQLMVRDMYDFNAKRTMRMITANHLFSSYYKTYIKPEMEYNDDFFDTIKSLYGRLKYDTSNFYESSGPAYLHPEDSAKVKFYPIFPYINLNSLQIWPDNLNHYNYQQYKLQELMLMDPHLPCVHYGHSLSSYDTHLFAKYEPSTVNGTYDTSTGAVKKGSISPNMVTRSIVQDFNYEEYQEHKENSPNIWNYIKENESYYWGNNEDNPTYQNNQTSIYNFGLLLNRYIQTNANFKPMYPINSLVDDSRFIFHYMSGNNVLFKSFMTEPTIVGIPAFRKLTRRGEGALFSTFTQADQSFWTTGDYNLLPRRYVITDGSMEIDPGRFDMRMNWDMSYREWLPILNRYNLKRILRPSLPNYNKYSTNFPGHLLNMSEWSNINNTFSCDGSFPIYKIYIPEITKDKDNERSIIIDITALIQEYHDETNPNDFGKWGGPILAIDLWRYEYADGRIVHGNILPSQIGWVNDVPSEESLIKQNYQFLRFLGCYNHDVKKVKRGIRCIKILSAENFSESLCSGYYILQIRSVFANELYYQGHPKEGYLYYCWTHEYYSEEKNKRDTEVRDYGGKTDSNNEYYITTGHYNPIFKDLHNFPTDPTDYIKDFNYVSCNINTISIKIGKRIGSEDFEQFQNQED